MQSNTPLFSKRAIPWTFGVVIILLSLTRCDTTVDPFRENNLHYSVFGFLNASADTQFIRVELLRDSLITSAPVNIDAEVTLTRIDTDQVIQLQDSIFNYSPGIAHNFFTTFDIEPTRTYRLTVRGSGNMESSAQVTVPPAFPEPVVVSPIEVAELNCLRRDSTSLVRIEGIDRLVAVNAIYHFEVDGGKRQRTFTHLADTSNLIDGRILATITHGNDLCRLSGGYSAENPPIIEKVEVVVAAGNHDWPDFVGLDEETMALPSIATNINNGTGLLGGIITDTVLIFPVNN